MKIGAKSMLTGHWNVMDIPINREKLDVWTSTPRNELPLIQHFFPELTPEQREFIKSGCTPEEWNAEIPEEEE